MKIIVLLFLINMDFSVTSSYGQERAKVVYYNPKYIAHASCFTSRASRGQHYRSNMSFTSRHDWGNNVTMKILYNMQANKIDFSWKTKFCDMLKHKWVMDFVKAFSNIEQRKCPLKAGKYVFNDVEFSARFLPLPLPPGVNMLTSLMYVTDTEERILEGNVILHVK